MKGHFRVHSLFHRPRPFCFGPSPGWRARVSFCEAEMNRNLPDIDSDNVFGTGKKGQDGFG